MAEAGMPKLEGSLIFGTFEAPEPDLSLVFGLITKRPTGIKTMASNRRISGTEMQRSLRFFEVFDGFEGALSDVSAAHAGTSLSPKGR